MVNRSHSLIHRRASLLMLAIAFYSLGAPANQSETISSLTLYHDEAKLDVAVIGVFDQSGMAEATVIETIRPDSLSVIDSSGLALVYRINLSEGAGDSVLGPLKGQSARLNQRSKLFGELDAEDNSGTIVQDQPILFQRGNEIFQVALDELVFEVGSREPAPNLEISGGVPGTPYNLGLQYELSGLSWRANYKLFFDPIHGKAELQTRALVSNQTPSPLVVSEMHMIAGAPKRLRAQEPMPMRARGMLMAEMSADEGLNPNMEQSEAAMFHRFTYAEPVSLAPGDRLSLPLQIHQSLPAVMSYQSDHRLNVYGRDATRQIEQPLGSVLTIDLTDAKASRKGKKDIVLPEGLVSAYAIDEHGTTLLGEDQIQASRAPSEVSLSLGDAFDLSIERSQVNFRRLSDRVVEVEMALRLRNRGPNPAAIEVIERIPGDWRLLNVTSGGEKRDAGDLVFDLTLDGDDSTVLSYRVNVRL